MQMMFKRTSLNLSLAFSVQPSGKFDENDGLWSTFNLQVGGGGSGPQNFRAIVSTSSYDTWLPTSASCANINHTAFPQAPSSSDCPSTQGVGLYDGSQSSGYDGSRSSTAKGQLSTETVDMGKLDPITLFGSDYNVTGSLWEDYLYMSSSTAPSALHSSSNRVAIFGIPSWQYYLSSIGIGVGEHLTTIANIGSINSTVSSMAAAGTIPSRSWGYTAGAYYDNNRLGSLVLGGYDQAQINGTATQFTMSTGSATNTELLVSVSSISIQYSNSTAPTSSLGAFTAVIDSTLPHLFLPNKTCDWLAEQLHLTYDNSTGLYTIDQTSLDSNKANINTFTITLGPTSQSSSSTSTDAIAIRFPYDAFNANASWTWGFESPTAIFPIRRAQSSTAVLGRAFFQEAYVSADYERNVFNVSQASLSSNGSQIISIYNSSTLSLTNSRHSSKLSAGAIAGIAIGGVAALIILALLLWFCWVKPNRQLKEAKEKPEQEGESERPQRGRQNTVESMVSGSTAVSELTSRPAHLRHPSDLSELPSDNGRRATSGTLDYIHEMEDKSDAVELEQYMARNQQSPPPQELEGEGHGLRSYGS